MTSHFYKKHYGYEDDIQLHDDDIKKLEIGMNLRKMNEKGDINDRFYRLDLVNNQLIATTKEFRKREKYYSLFNLTGIKKGCSSDNLKEYMLKKSIRDKAKATELEETAFVLIYDNSSKSLDLLAPNEIERDRWVRVLDYFIILCKKRKGVLPETDEIMRNYFQIADKSKDKTITVNEITKFLESINLKLKKEQLKSLITNYDSNADGKLDQREFEEFMKRLSARKDIMSIFKIIASDNEDSQEIPEYMSLKKFQKFLARYQLEIKTEQECQEIIMKYEPTDNKFEYRITLPGFIIYLNALEQHIMEPKIYENIYQNMDLPLQNYFMNSSHNTYLSGDQLKSDSKVDCYISVLMKGCRLLELDCHDGTTGPEVFHNYTLTSHLKFEDIIIAVKEFAFKVSEYPVILTLENHCSQENQILMAQYIVKHLDEFLYKSFDPNMKQLPPLSSLKRKIFIRSAKKEAVKKNKNGERVIEEEDLDDNDDDVELANLINLFQNVSYKGTDVALQNNKPYNGSSLSEPKLDKLIAEEIFSLINLAHKFLVKSYPAGGRVDSSNYDPSKYWNCGVQMVALNFQKQDEANSLNTALFNDNGQCGYVLKPQILRDLSLNFNPNDINTMMNKKDLTIKIISGQNLPEPSSSEFIKDIIDPYVQVKIFGVKADEKEQKTKFISDNGFNPFWNEDFKFQINCPELAIVKFAVYDKDDASGDDLIGYYSIRFENMRQGYRHIQLENKTHKGTIFVGITITPHKEFVNQYNPIFNSPAH